MRIISGVAKGMVLAAPPGKNQSIRPTSSRAREALFFVLAGKIAGSTILDLYAGTGALGLEAISRGALSATFIDYGSLSLTLLKKNISTMETYLKGKAPCTILKHDLRKGLKNIGRKISNKTRSSIPVNEAYPFDLIFLDPPYDKRLASLTLHHLDKEKLLAKDGLIIAEERTKTKMPDNLESLTLHDQRNYGDTGFWIYCNT